MVRTKTNWPQHSIILAGEANGEKSHHPLIRPLCHHAKQGCVGSVTWKKADAGRDSDKVQTSHQEASDFLSCNNLEWSQQFFFSLVFWWKENKRREKEINT